METTITAGRSGNRWIVFTPEADLSGYEPAALRTWTIEHKEPTTGTMIQTADRIADMKLRQNEEGGYDPGAYTVAYQGAFAREHITAVRDGTGEIVEGDLPPQIQAAFVFRNDPNRPATQAEIEALKKPKPAESFPD